MTTIVLVQNLIDNISTTGQRPANTHNLIKYLLISQHSQAIGKTRTITPVSLNTTIHTAHWHAE